MVTGIHRETAKIFQFPVGGRSGLLKKVDVRNLQNEKEQIVKVVDIGGWYHDEAIRTDGDSHKPNA